MSTHDEDILQYRINAYVKCIADLEEQLVAMEAAADERKNIFKEAVRRVKELEAQIALKDEALRKIRHLLCEEKEAHASEIAFIDAALAPTREAK